MAWVTPKTDWLPEDFFNAEDWNRIVGNIRYIKSLADKLYPEFSITTMEDKTYRDIPYAREINVIEENIYKIDKNTFPLGLVGQKTWYANQIAPTYEDFNRWEKYTLKLKLSLEAQLLALRRLSFTFDGGAIQI